MEKIGGKVNLKKVPLSSLSSQSLRVIGCVSRIVRDAKDAKQFLLVKIMSHLVTLVCCCEVKLKYTLI